MRSPHTCCTLYASILGCHVLAGSCDYAFPRGASPSRSRPTARPFVFIIRLINGETLPHASPELLYKLHVLQ